MPLASLLLPLSVLLQGVKLANTLTALWILASGTLASGTLAIGILASGTLASRTLASGTLASGCCFQKKAQTPDQTDHMFSHENMTTNKEHYMIMNMMLNTKY